jgi:hypothetical protein
MTLRIYNEHTGEILGPDYYVRNRKQDEAYRKQLNHGKDTRHFSFTHMLNIREITDHLSNVYCGYIVMLQPYIQWQTNVLIDDNGPMKRKELAKVLRVSARTTKTVVNVLKDLAIINELEDGTFTINDRYHFRKKAGNDVDVLIKTFFTALKSLNLKPAEFGFLYRLLPYVHYDTNIICEDPFVETPSEIRFLNEKQIGELIGMSDSKTKALLSKLRKATAIGEFIRQEGDSRDKLTVLNPYVFYRKNGKPDGTLAAMFGARGSLL